MSIEKPLRELKNLLSTYFTTDKGLPPVVSKKKAFVKTFEELEKSCKERENITVIEEKIKNLTKALKDVSKKDPNTIKNFNATIKSISEMAASNSESNTKHPPSSTQKQGTKSQGSKTDSKTNSSKQQTGSVITQEVLKCTEWIAEYDPTKQHSGITRDYIIGNTDQKNLNDEEKQFYKIFQYHMDIIFSKIEKLYEEVQRLQEEKESQNHERQAKVLGRPQTSHAQRDERVIQMNKDLEKALQENHTLKNRISKMAGVQLTHQNAAIADLSDPNRPTKIAEKYVELYDNSWTDAMEKLQKNCKNEKEIEQSEKQFISLLKGDLQNCYNFCKEKSEKQLEEIKNVLFLTDNKEASNKSGSLSKEFQKEINETRKCTAPAVVEVIQKEFIESDANHKTSCREYLNDCLELCWYMVVQDPPVCLHFGDQQHGSVIDTARFDFYTRSGKKLDFLVWPALLLEAEGPLLRKGVAQPLP